MTSLGLIIAAGGTSSRFGQGDKLAVPYNGMPLFCHCLRNLLTFREVTAAVLVVHSEHLASYRRIISQFLPDLTAQLTLIPGGSSRAESIFNGFRELMQRSAPVSYIAIHDAARPLASSTLLEECFHKAMHYGAAIAAHPITDTIHVANTDGTIASTPQRDFLWGAETPQVFSAELLKQAYSKLDWRSSPPTDEASLVMQLPGTTVYLVKNTNSNPKITYNHDLHQNII